MLPGVSGCYDSPADYDANINADLDLLQAELEVSQSLDNEAYQQITTLAAQLEYSPVRILEYVTNAIQHEYYLGSVKGALGVVESGGANDVDHANLLIALLRASSIPACTICFCKNFLRVFDILPSTSFAADFSACFVSLNLVNAFSLVIF